MKQLLLASVLLAGVLTASADEIPIVYHDLTDGYPVLGTLAPDASEIFTRLPDSLHNVVRQELWDLGLNSAGLSVRFRTDSPRLKARWHSRNKFAMNHMTPTGIRGLDLYVLQDDSTWTTVCSARPSMASASSTSSLVADMEPGVMREYMLFLSLYDGVDSLAIGIDSACMIMPSVLDLPRRSKPVVMYGTSILQGGCATRPGMAHTNILQRELQREVVNLGFSGNARLDPEIARLMAQADASCYVIDPLPNCTAAQVAERMPEFIAILRAARPTTPIIVVESPMFPISRFDTEVYQTLTEKNRTLRKYYQENLASDPNVVYFPTGDIMRSPEDTVDNYHFTDAGFEYFAAQLLPILRKLIDE